MRNGGRHEGADEDVLLLCPQPRTLQRVLRHRIELLREHPVQLQLLEAGEGGRNCASLRRIAGQLPFQFRDLRIEPVEPGLQFDDRRRIGRHRLRSDEIVVLQVDFLRHGLQEQSRGRGRRRDRIDEALPVAEIPHVGQRRANEAFAAADFVLRLPHDSHAGARRNQVGELLAGVNHGLRQHLGVRRSESPHRQCDDPRGSVDIGPDHLFPVVGQLVGRGVVLQASPEIPLGPLKNRLDVDLVALHHVIRDKPRGRRVISMHLSVEGVQHANGTVGRQKQERRY